MATDNKPPDFIVKILLVGDVGVGKTSLLLRFADDTFQTNFITTIGVDFKIKRINHNGKDIKLQIWDTAGQERFRTITAAYYRGASGILLCFDLSDRLSFQHLDAWKKDIEKHSSGTDIIVCGLKNDLPAVVFEDEAKAFAQQHKLKYFEVSPRNNYNVTEVILALTDLILVKKLAISNENSTIAVGSSPATSQNDNCNC